MNTERKRTSRNPLHKMERATRTCSPPRHKMERGEGVRFRKAFSRSWYYTLLSAYRFDITGIRWLVRYYNLHGDQVVNAWPDHIQEYIGNMSGAIYHATTTKVLTDYDALDFAESL